MNEALTPPKWVAKARAEEIQTIYRVTDQHGLNISIYFAYLKDARAYVDRCKPNKYILVPVPVWPSLAARDATDEEGVG